jgi:hypothetical protein
MISIIISFRFTKKYIVRVKEIEKTFNYYTLLRDIYDLELIFVNDHSEHFERSEDYIFDFPGKKINWNQGAGRNFGATLAKGDKLFFTDIDHILYGDFGILDKVDMTDKYLTFSRSIRNNGIKENIQPHINTFLINATDFLRYDEEFCGNYGYDDKEFLYRLQKTHSRVHIKNLVHTFVTEVRSTDLPRDKEINRLLYLKKTSPDNHT